MISSALAAIVLAVASPGAAEGKVLLEQYNSGPRFKDTGNFGHKSLVSALGASGYAVDIYGEPSCGREDRPCAKPLTAEALAGHGVLILDGLRRPLSAGETAAILSFAEAGGGVLLIGGSFRDSSSIHSVAPLLAFLGLTMSPVREWSGKRLSTAFLEKSHPVTKDLERIHMSNPAALEVSDASVSPIVLARLNGRPVLVAARRGKGAFVAFGGGSAFMEQTLSPGWAHNGEPRDNLRLLARIMEFLRSPGAPAPEQAVTTPVLESWAYSPSTLAARVAAVDAWTAALARLAAGADLREAEIMRHARSRRKAPEWVGRSYWSESTERGPLLLGVGLMARSKLPGLMVKFSEDRARGAISLALNGKTRMEGTMRITSARGSIGNARPIDWHLDDEGTFHALVAAEPPR